MFDSLHPGSNIETAAEGNTNNAPLTWQRVADNAAPAPDNSQLPTLPGTSDAEVQPRIPASASPHPVKGIDLYEGIGTVDYDKVKGAGYDFVIPRASYGLYSDKKYVENIDQARSSGMKVGGYCFFRPTQDAHKQAQVCADQIKAAGGFKPGDIGVVADFESAKAYKTVSIKVWDHLSHHGRHGHGHPHFHYKTHQAAMDAWKLLPKQNRLGVMQTFLDDLEAKTGKKPVIYGSSLFFSPSFFGDLKSLSKYDLWVANYNDVPEPLVPEPWKSGSGWTLWQATPEGKVPGQKPKADIDSFNGDQDAYDKHFGK